MTARDWPLLAGWPGVFGLSRAVAGSSMAAGIRDSSSSFSLAPHIFHSSQLEACERAFVRTGMQRRVVCVNSLRGQSCSASALPSRGYHHLKTRGAGAHSCFWEGAR